MAIYIRSARASVRRESSFNSDENAPDSANITPAQLREAMSDAALGLGLGIKSWSSSSWYGDYKAAFLALPNPTPRDLEYVMRRVNPVFEKAKWLKVDWSLHPDRNEIGFIAYRRNTLKSDERPEA